MEIKPDLDEEILLLIEKKLPVDLKRHHFLSEVLDENCELEIEKQISKFKNKTIFIALSTHLSKIIQGTFFLRASFQWCVPFTLRSFNGGIYVFIHILRPLMSELFTEKMYSWKLTNYEQ